MICFCFCHVKTQLSQIIELQAWNLSKIQVHLNYSIRTIYFNRKWPGLKSLTMLLHNDKLTIFFSDHFPIEALAKEGMWFKRCAHTFTTYHFYCITYYCMCRIIKWSLTKEVTFLFLQQFVRFFGNVVIKVVTNYWWKYLKKKSNFKV